MITKYCLLICCIWFGPPANAQDTPHNPEAIDKSVHAAIDPVALYFADPLKPASVRQTSVTPFAPFHWTDKAEPTTWFQPHKYSAPAMELLPQTAAKPRWMPPPTATAPPSPGFGNPFFVPGFSRSIPFPYRAGPNNKPRKPRRSTPPPSAR
jgi:hypothetical protein